MVRLNNFDRVRVMDDTFVGELCSMRLGTLIRAGWVPLKPVWAIVLGVEREHSSNTGCEFHVYAYWSDIGLGTRYIDDGPCEVRVVVL